jgi:hypothetical protein
MFQESNHGHLERFVNSFPIKGITPSRVLPVAYQGSSCINNVKEQARESDGEIIGTPAQI